MAQRLQNEVIIFASAKAHPNAYGVSRGEVERKTVSGNLIPIGDCRASNRVEVELQ
jgi:hypothetical protein